MEPFKNLINPQLIRAFATHLGKHDIDARRFVRLALDGLESREMKARAELVAEALAHVLPRDFDRAASILEATLATVQGDAEGWEPGAHTRGVAGWIVWPMTMYIAAHGGDHPERALTALHAMTQRFTSEFAIRTFVRDHPALTFATLERWLVDPSPHVRRLISEGTRPRLPWGMRLTALVADPSPSLPLLEALRDDPSEYVRRSVANHLNDIAKDHPERFAAILEQWLEGASPERTRLLKHASRTLVKAGHPRVLQAFGLHRELDGEASFRLTPKRIVLGESLQLELTLRSSAKHAQKLVIDYVVHHRKKDGSTSPKVFKGWNLELAPGERRVLSRAHAVRPITTRTYYAGAHRVECLINGRAIGAPLEFSLKLA